jgi:hypothetical protein
MLAEGAHHADEADFCGFRVSDAENIVLLHPSPWG